MYAEPKHIKSLASITSISARTVPKFKAGPQNEALFCTVTQRVFSPLFGAPNCRITWLQNSQPVPNGFKDKLSGGAAGTHILADRISFARFFIKLLNIRRIRSTAFYRRGRRRGDSAHYRRLRAASLTLQARRYAMHIDDLFLGGGKLRHGLALRHIAPMKRKCSRVRRALDFGVCLDTYLARLLFTVSS
ncbi:hypothetical protein DFH08DRAFT_799053 [Mycena albidolilacea]|uniref:Uncharacterized protein n=1 Tax=Mycena albidolilacea TaxID=1033008 RepID=A0AAD7AQY9_9AGAR|nr:hypothetical protein DFH08DRAFT_799053 [Mycena albidolilacea]